MLNVNPCRHEVWQHPPFSSRRSWSVSITTFCYWRETRLELLSVSPCTIFRSANFSHSLVSFSVSSFDTFAIAWHWARLSSRCTDERESKIDCKWNTDVVIGAGEAGGGGLADDRQQEPLVQLEVHWCSRRSKKFVSTFSCAPVSLRQQTIHCDVPYSHKI